ncbi:Symplekin/Pta1 [Lasallia pustulata]|uniref:Symplekin/Pta1 n=1 Tax=Lasallia pustulata TaxID=136370 RepID=A0A1W5DCF3_9LECA|nr:Symplekin/Pta1 [Lasallia pustulata]
MALPIPEQLNQLNAARQLVLGDSAFYPQIVQGILPIVGATARLELRRWGADFLAETFASPVLALQQKENLSLVVLQTLKDLLEMPGDDPGVVKSVVQAAASIYGLVFRYIINNPNDSPTWEKMAAIKSNILKRWDTAATGIRICCIKFVQRVVQVQTPGVVADPRRPDQNEISLALVPRDHPLIPPRNLEAEASGLLDRLLNVFYEETSDAVLVNATLNCLGGLVRSRQSIANKILSTVLNFNPLKLANSPMTPKLKVQIKSMERTTRAFLINILRRNENGPFAARIKQHVDRLAQSRLDIFDEGSRKRGLPEPTDGLSDAKRARLGADLPGRTNIPPLPPGPTSIAQLYTLTGDEGLTSFDVTQLPIDLVVKITLPVLYRIDQGLLDEAINGIRSRYLSLARNQPTITQGPPLPPTALEDEDDDYEPDFEPVEDTEQILNAADALPPEDSHQTPTEVALGPFTLPQPPPLTEDDAKKVGKGTVMRVFSMMNILDEPAAAKRQKPGLNRLAGSNYDREAWITVITRLASRASSGLEDSGIEAKDELESNGTVAKRKESSLSDGIRETLYIYIIEDFRARIPIAIAWLNEEWYNDRIQSSSAEQSQNGDSQPLTQTQPHYEKWVLKVLDGIVPYLDAKDKVLIRFLSEIPGVDEKVLQRVKGLARDPERVSLAVNAIHYLILLRPPVRDICIDALEDLWRNYDDAKVPTTKVLAKWRPQVLQQVQDVNGSGVKEEEDTNAAGTAPALAAAEPVPAQSAVAAVG